MDNITGVARHIYDLPIAMGEVRGRNGVTGMGVEVEIHRRLRRLGVPNQAMVLNDEEALSRAICGRIVDVGAGFAKKTAAARNVEVGDTAGGPRNFRVK